MNHNEKHKLQTNTTVVFFRDIFTVNYRALGARHFFISVALRTESMAEDFVRASLSIVTVPQPVDVGFHIM